MSCIVSMLLVISQHVLYDFYKGIVALFFAAMMGLGYGITTSFHDIFSKVSYCVITLISYRFRLFLPGAQEIANSAVFAES